MMLDVTPLKKIVQARQPAINSWGSNDARTWYRAMATGRISDKNADRICIRHLHLQPELVWPELTGLYE